MLLAAGAAAATVLAAEFGVRALMPAGRLLSPTAIEVFAARAASEATMIRADPGLGHVPVLGGPVYDEHGLLREWSLRAGTQKTPGTPRFLFLGDSVTRRATIVAPLSALRSGPTAEFLVAGVESWNPVQEVEFYFRHQQALAADHVVLSLHNNDLTESTVACLRDGQFTLCNPGAHVAVDPGWYRTSILYQLWVASRHTDRLRPEHYLFRADDVERALQRLRDDLAARGARFTVLLLPIFAKAADWQDHERRARERELQLLRALGIDFVDLQPACEELAALGLPVRALPTDPYHPNDACGALLALAAAPVLFEPPALAVRGEPRGVAPGGTQTLAIDGGPALAGREVVLLGSYRGLWPTTEARGRHVPLADDDHLRRLAASPAPFAAVLDAAGKAEFVVPYPAGVQQGVIWHLVVASDGAAQSWPVPLLVRR